jgi:hypothetical protein
VRDFIQTPVPTPEGWSGAVFVEIMPAVEKFWHDSVRGNVSEVFPALRVTTYTSRARDNSAGVKYRGRTYHVDRVHVLAPGRGYGPDGWTYDTSEYYTKGLLNDSGSSVDWKSPMRERVSNFAEAVRDAYIADHPQWARDSLAMRLQGLIRREVENAASRRAEAAQCDARADKLRAELGAL